MNTLGIMLGVLVLAAAAPVQPVKLTSEMFADYHYRLISDKQVEDYSFSSKYGTVLMTFGRQNGPVTGPGGTWKIEDGKTLRITDGGDINISYVFSSITETNAVTVTGKHFVRKKAPKK